MNLRARSYGFTYRPAADIAETAELSELIDRLKAVVPSQTPMTPKVQRDTDALLGLAEPTSTTITQAMDLYLSEIALDELSGKSPEQVANYSKVKRRAVGNFVRMNGDMDMVGVIRNLLIEEKRRRDDDGRGDEIFIRPDHGHQMMGDINKANNPGYSCVGRLKGLAEIRGVIHALTSVI